MSAGYVYILINQSMPNLIKIGRTFRDSRERARELHTTGVPTPFDVAFELFSLEHEKIEDKLHQKLASFRISQNREFFRYPLKDAIALLLEINQSIAEGSMEFVAESIFQELIDKYRRYLKPSIKDVRIVQTSDRVWLEITEEVEIGGYLKDQIIRRTDLAFISDGEYDGLIFRPEDHIYVNSKKFVNEFDPYSIMMTTDLFHEEGCREINEKFNPHDHSLENEPSG